MGVWVRRIEKFELSTMQIVAVRAIITFVIMLIFMLIYDRKLFKIKLRDIWCFLGTGLISIVFFSFCYFSTILATSLSVAAILLYTAPAIVVVLSLFFFKEKISLRKLLALLSAFIGCIFVSGVIGSDISIKFSAILTGLGSGLGYGLYSIFGRCALERNYHPFTLTFYTFLFASLGVIPFANIGGLCVKFTQNPTLIPWSLCLGIICTVLPYIFYSLGLKYMEAGNASILASVEPVAATIFGIILFNEQLTLQTASGILFILLMLMILNVKLPAKKLKS